MPLKYKAGFLVPLALGFAALVLILLSSRQFTTSYETGIEPGTGLPGDAYVLSSLPGLGQALRDQDRKKRHDLPTANPLPAPRSGGNALVWHGQKDDGGFEPFA